MDVYCAHADTSAMVEEIANRLSTGRLRVHDHLEEWFAGYRRYRRDEKGDVMGALLSALTPHLLKLIAAVATIPPKGIPRV